MTQAKKIIDKTIVWTCDNLDLNAPINWQGYSILFNDNTSAIVEKNENLNCYEIASKQERKDHEKKSFKYPAVPVHGAGALPGDG